MEMRTGNPELRSMYLMRNALSEAEGRPRVKDNFAEKPRSMLIIGLGNLDRGDDAAGILVAQRLAERGVGAVQHTGGTLNLLHLWDTAEEVILVDAVISGAAVGTVQSWDTCAQTLQNDAFQSSTHEFGLADTIELARAVNRLPKALTIYGIEAAKFVPGTPPCSRVLAGIDRVADEIYSRVNHRRPGHA